MDQRLHASSVRDRLVRNQCTMPQKAALVGSVDLQIAKPVPDMTYNVFSGTLNPTQSINQS